MIRREQQVADILADKDAIVIGGGFYGAAIAIYLVKQRGLPRVLLVEQENALLSRASYNNQARVHNGYHYPRSYTTAFRSRVNLPRFIRDWSCAIKQDFTKLYAIARRNSKVTAKQFERFCREIGANIQPAERAHRSLFDPRFIEEVFEVEEYAFDTTKLADWAYQELRQCGVEIRLQTHASIISRNADETLSVTLENSRHETELISTERIFNCTYSGLNHFSGDFQGTQTILKHEIAEMALLDVPPNLSSIGITIMDGPFFSLMPFPARGLHTLSHVRYTPHMHWYDHAAVNPYQHLASYEQKTRFHWMIRDAGRYVPDILNAKYKDSLFEIKTVLAKNESDDGRPILMERHVSLPGCYSVLGGKIDNIYDVLEKLDTELF